MYHNIGLAPHNSTWPRLYVSPKAFKQQMSWLRRLGFHGRSIRDATSELNGVSSAKVAVITFDDGFTDVYENALPILKEIGFTATCYFVSRCLGTYNSWDQGVLIERKPTMTREQVTEWIQAGMEIGSHGCNHFRMTSCAPEVCDCELSNSKVELEHNFGAKVESFSYPFGDYNAQVVARVQAAGYLSAVTTRPGRVTPRDDPFRMRRINLNGKRGLMPFIVSVTTNYQNWRERRPD
jgi:peptidoglycan/xylan/chitin deacetylase (PgdA/CDA1 family)